ncbi:MAG: hypothetical protein KAV42_00505 [Candidatus Krumholzibacteria bacterium]|nr:hypothetical protein [Candidatus Krumholzibacteria bacterium]
MSDSRKMDEGPTLGDELRQSLNQSRNLDRGGRGLYILLAFVLIVSLVNLFVFVIDNMGAGNGGMSGGGKGLSAEAIEKLALKLERQQLYGAAARAWTDYLSSTNPSGEESAGIWYRIGKLYQGGGDFERALDAYYRSESIEHLKDLEAELSLRVSECLERLGRFAALRSELESRTALDPDAPTAGEEVLAEIGSWKISRSDLEKMVEAEIEAQLSSVAGGLPSDQRKAQKDRLLAEVLSEDRQQQLLERFVAEELLYRRAMEERLYDDPAYRELARNLEKKMMIQKYMDGQYAANIKISDQEVREYYEAHKADFIKDGQQVDFEEAGQQAYAMLRRSREMEIQAQLIGFLMDEYDVVVHRSKSGGEKKPEDGQ